MQIRNSLYIKRYVLGTFLNFFILLIFFYPDNIKVYIFFVLCILLNQFFLHQFGLKFLGLTSSRSFIPAPLLVVSKFLALILAFMYALKFAPHSVHFLVLSYIFQLIILVISTKRVVKKN